MENSNETKAEERAAFYRSIVQATADLTTTLTYLETANKQEPRRTTSIAITKVEEAIMWLKKGE